MIVSATPMYQYDDRLMMCQHFIERRRTMKSLESSAKKLNFEPIVLTLSFMYCKDKKLKFWLQIRV